MCVTGKTVRKSKLSQFCPRSEQVEGKWKALRLALKNAVIATYQFRKINRNGLFIDFIRVNRLPEALFQKRNDRFIDERTVGYSRIIRNVFLLRNKVNQTHPNNQEM